MSRIFKINHIQDNNIKHIYLFVGNREFESENYGPEGEKIFSLQEWRNIETKHVPISIIPHYIHGDDTISILKKKLIKYLKFQKSMKQLYLFSIKHEKLNPSTIHDQLSQGGKMDITNDVLCQFLTNIVSSDCNDFDNKVDCHSVINKHKIFTIMTTCYP